MLSLSLKIFLSRSGCCSGVAGWHNNFPLQRWGFPDAELWRTWLHSCDSALTSKLYPVDKPPGSMQVAKSDGTEPWISGHRSETSGNPTRSEERLCLALFGRTGFKRYISFEEFWEESCWNPKVNKLFFRYNKKILSELIFEQPFQHAPVVPAEGLASGIPQSAATLTLRVITDGSVRREISGRGRNKIFCKTLKN